MWRLTNKLFSNIYNSTMAHILLPADPMALFNSRGGSGEGVGAGGGAQWGERGKICNTFNNEDNFFLKRNIILYQ